jgi:hypothetical protein
MYGITPLELRSLAYQMADRNSLRHRFKKDKKVTRQKWYYVKSPRSTPSARGTGFSTWSVSEFLDVLEKLVHQIKMPPESSMPMKQAFIQCRRQLEMFMVQRG